MCLQLKGKLSPLSPKLLTIMITASYTVMTAMERYVIKKFIYVYIMIIYEWRFDCGMFKAKRIEPAPFLTGTQRNTTFQ